MKSFKRRAQYFPNGLGMRSKPKFKTPVVLYLLSLLLLLCPVSSIASDSISLDAAKKQGEVGEKLNGYLGAVSESPSAAVSALIADVNSRRKSKYQEISKQNGTPLEAVEKLAAVQAIEKTEAGNYIEQSPGSWIKK